MWPYPAEILPPLSLTDMEACLNAFTDHSPSKLKSLPLLSQNGRWDRTQTFFFFFDRVQEITVYISSCITWTSKLSGFGGGGGRGMLCFKHNMGGGLSLLTTLVPPPKRKSLISSLFCSGPAVSAQRAECLSADAEYLWRAYCFEGNHSGTNDPKTFLPSAFWSSSSNNWEGLFLFSFLRLLVISFVVCLYRPMNTENT